MGSVWYVQRVIISGRLKTLIVEYLKDATGTNIEIGTIGYIFPKSISLRDVVIFQKESSTEEFININKLRFNFLPMPLLKKKQIIIPNLIINSAKLNIPNKKPITLKNLRLQGEYLPDKSINYSTSCNISPEFQVMLHSKGMYLFKEKIFTADFRLKNQEFVSSGNIKAENDKIQLSNLHAEFLNSKLEASAEISNYSLSPQLNLNAKSQIELSDIIKIYKRYPVPSRDKTIHCLNNIEPRGLCKLEFSMEGTLQNPKALQIISNVNSKHIELFRLNFGEMTLDVTMKEGIIQIPKFSFSPYGGAINIILEADINQRNLPYAMQISAGEVDLSKWKLDTGLKDKEILGSFSSEFIVTGNGFNSDAIKAKGWAMITQGRLWEIPILGSLADFLGVSALKRVIIKEAAGNFAVANQKLYSQDLHFLSDEVILLAKGLMDFKGNLNVNITSSFTPKFLQSGGQFGRIASLVVDQTGKFIGNIKLTGTIKKPKYSLVAIPLEKIIGGKIFESLKGLFK